MPKTPTSAADIGDAYIEGREHCAASGADGCFLTDKQRDRLVNAYRDEVRAAEAIYIDACTSVRIELLAEKEEELPAVLQVLLAAFGGVATDAIVSAVKIFAHGGPKKAVEGIEWMLELQGVGYTPPAPTTIQSLMQGGASEEAKAALKAGVDIAKKSIHVPAKSESIQLSYLTALKTMAAFAFQHQAQDPPGYATDAQMVVLFHSYKAEAGHTPQGYQSAIRDKIDRYKGSHASKIGRTLHTDVPKDGSLAPGSRTVRDTKVVWVQTAGVPEMLVYFKRDFGHTFSQLDPKARQPGAPIASNPDDDEAFVPISVVEPEFVDVAIAKHEEQWGAPPEHRKMTQAELSRDVKDLTQFVPQTNPLFYREPEPPASSPAPTKPAQAKNDPPIKVPKELVLK